MPRHISAYQCRGLASQESEFAACPAHMLSFPPELGGFPRVPEAGAHTVGRFTGSARVA